MSGSPARRASSMPRTMEDEIFGADTRRLPAEVVRAVVKAADERADAAAKARSEQPRTNPLASHLPSGTRKRVSIEDIAAFLAERLDADDVVVEIDDADLIPDEPPAAAVAGPALERDTVSASASASGSTSAPSTRAPALDPAFERETLPVVLRAEVAPAPIAAPASCAYPAPRIEVGRRALLEDPRAVFVLAMGTVILVLGPLVYILMR
jgi:hypothetical protein